MIRAAILGFGIFYALITPQTSVGAGESLRHFNEGECVRVHDAGNGLGNALMLRPNNVASEKGKFGVEHLTEKSLVSNDALYQKAFIVLARVIDNANGVLIPYRESERPPSTEIAPPFCTFKGAPRVYVTLGNGLRVSRTLVFKPTGWCAAGIDDFQQDIWDRANTDTMPSYLRAIGVDVSTTLIFTDFTRGRVSLDSRVSRSLSLDEGVSHQADGPPANNGGRHAEQRHNPLRTTVAQERDWGDWRILAIAAAIYVLGSVLGYLLLRGWMRSSVDAHKNNSSKQ